MIVWSPIRIGADTVSEKTMVIPAVRSRFSIWATLHGVVGSGEAVALVDE